MHKTTHLIANSDKRNKTALSRCYVQYYSALQIKNYSTCLSVL